MDQLYTIINIQRHSRSIDERTISGTKIKDFYNYYKTTREIKILEDIYITYNIKQYRGQYIHRQ